tara:strand:- start:1178 stop:1651 length:474 start_codon:yes stop_codon:yes gene_type:complete
MSDLRKFYTMPKKKFVKNADFRNWKKEMNFTANKLIPIESNFLDAVIDNKKQSLFEPAFNTALLYWNYEVNKLIQQNVFKYTIPNTLFLSEKYLKRFNRSEIVYTEVEESLPIGFLLLRFRWHIQKFIFGSKSKGYSRLIGSMIYRYKRNIYGERLI